MDTNEIDAFYEFAKQQAADGEVSIERCLSIWRSQHAGKLDSVEPFPNDQTLHDRLVASGVLGHKKDGPADLSTNPNYMKGFGES